MGKAENEGKNPQQINKGDSKNQGRNDRHDSSDKGSDASQDMATTQGPIASTAKSKCKYILESE